MEIQLNPKETANHLFGVMLPDHANIWAGYHPGYHPATPGYHPATGWYPAHLFVGG